MYMLPTKRSHLPRAHGRYEELMVGFRELMVGLLHLPHYCCYMMRNVACYTIHARICVTYTRMDCVTRCVTRHVA